MTDATFFQTSYDRGRCSIGIVHIGYGAFHRAHQAVYLDDYMQKTGDLRWGIAAVNLRASESNAFATAASAGDGYLLKSIAPNGTQEFRMVRSHLGFVDASRDTSAAIELFCRPPVHAASITVTESGYSFREDWSLDLDAAPIAAELAGGPVTTIYGFLAAALEARSRELNAPITILCCDNIRSNGHVLERALHQYISALGKTDLLNWIKTNVSFPCSMVDRITPRATPALEEEVRQLWPASAVAPIHAEDFSQWVLQARFADAMPDLAKAGVQVVEDVEPFEEAKIRILNGGHTGLTYLGALAGHVTFDAAMTDTKIRPHFDTWEEEVLFGLGGEFPFDLQEYSREIARRFENPGIADQLERICMDGYSKMGIYIRPTLDACLAKGRKPVAGYNCAASWVVYARKHAAGKMPVTYHEPFWDKLAPLLTPDRVKDLAQDANLWGDLPQKYPDFVPGLLAAIQRMEEQWQD
ncbi:MAG: mannitol dehydrogenase family protein [Pseudomonadota bacterium]